MKQTTEPGCGGFCATRRTGEEFIVRHFPSGDEIRICLRSISGGQATVSFPQDKDCNFLVLRGEVIGTPIEAHLLSKLKKRRSKLSPLRALFSRSA